MYADERLARMLGMDGGDSLEGCALELTELAQSRALGADPTR